MNTPVELRRCSDVMLKSGSYNAYKSCTNSAITYYIYIHVQAKAQKSKRTIIMCHTRDMCANFI